MSGSTKIGVGLDDNDSRSRLCLRAYVEGYVYGWACARGASGVPQRSELRRDAIAYSINHPVIKLMRLGQFYRALDEMLDVALPGDRG